MLDITPYRTPDGLDISAEVWKQLRTTTPDETLATALCAAAEGMPMPDAEIGPARALKAFKALQATPLHDLLEPGPLTLLRSPSATQPDYHTRLRPPGNAASNHFFHTVRLRTPKANAPSAWEKWHNPSLRLSVFRRLLRLKKVDYLNNSTVRLALHMTGATPVQFKPGVAKAVYELTNAKRVLDFSMGWGDRLAGFCASAGTVHYTGIDPNPELHPLYRQQVRMYGSEKSFDLMQGAAEDVPLPPNHFDLVFTSPPYFGMEKYAADTGNESTQSWCRHPTAEGWRDGFLRPVIAQAWASLVPGGILAINIADISHHGEAYPLCDWVRSIVREMPKSQYKFTLGMRLQGANYSDDRRSQVSGEPIWIWSKGDRNLPLALPGTQAQTIEVAQSRRTPGTPAIASDVVQQVIAEYTAMIGATTIARAHGISKRTVYNILIRNGHKLRPRSDRKGEPTSTPVSIVRGLNRMPKTKNPRQ